MEREQQTLMLRQLTALKQFQAIQKQNLEERVLKGDKSGVGEKDWHYFKCLDNARFAGKI